MATKEDNFNDNSCKLWRQFDDMFFCWPRGHGIAVFRIRFVYNIEWLAARRIVPQSSHWGGKSSKVSNDDEQMTTMKRVRPSFDWKSCLLTMVSKPESRVNKRWWGLFMRSGVYGYDVTSTSYDVSVMTTSSSAFGRSTARQSIFYYETTGVFWFNTLMMVVKRLSGVT